MNHFNDVWLIHEITIWVNSDAKRNILIIFALNLLLSYDL